MVLVYVHLLSPISVGNYKLGAVILSSSLANGHNNGLVVPRHNHSAHTIRARRKAFHDLGFEKTPVPLRVDDSKIRKVSRVRRLSCPQRSNVLDRDVAVTDYVAILVQVLRSRIVARRWVCLEARSKMGRLNGYVERCIGWQIITRLGMDDD